MPYKNVKMLKDIERQIRLIGNTLIVATHYNNTELNQRWIVKMYQLDRHGFHFC